MFVESIVKIKTINKDVLDSEWALTSCALKLVCTCQQIRMCASCMTNPKSVNDYFIPTRRVILVCGHLQKSGTLYWDQTCPTEMPSENLHNFLERSSVGHATNNRTLLSQTV